MSRIALLLVLALVATSAGASVADARPRRKPAVLKIKKAPAIPDGLRIAVQEGLVMDLLVDTGGAGMGKMAVQMTTATPFDIEVIDADGAAVRRATVVYGKATTVQSMSGSASTSDDARSGKTYRLEAGASGIKITDGAGVDVTAAGELEDLRQEHAVMMRGTPIRSFLLGRTFKSGKKVKLGADEFEAIFPSEANVTVDKFAITLESVKGKVARFSFDSTFTLTKEGTPMAIKATGTFDVDTRLVLPLAVSIDGTIDATMKQDTTTMTMTGTIKATRSYTYKVP